MSNGLDFERQVHALLKNMGFEAEITKASGDGGIDIIAHSKEHITGGKYIIQCKDWSKPVGEPPVRDLYGVVTAENANKGILITTSTFTAPAINFAAGKPLELIDGAKFNQLLSKYSVAGSQGGALSTADDERIKALTEQLNKNPKNILVIKELADIYLLQSNYNRAAELYETIVPLKPTVATERLTNAYTGGLNNYGVALAKLKRYEEALKIFQKTSYSGCLQEARLTHYLELFDIATDLYQKLKAGINSPALDEKLEKAYLQMPPEYPSLNATISKDGQHEDIAIWLETAQQKAAQEGNGSTYQPIFDAYYEVIDSFLELWPKLEDQITNNLILEQSETEEQAQTNVSLRNMCIATVLEYGHILDITTNNALQEANRRLATNQTEILKLIQEAISKYIDCINESQIESEDEWEKLRGEIFLCVSGGVSSVLAKMEATSQLFEKWKVENEKIITYWESIINKEKAEWREKLRNTIYANRTPQPPINANTQPQNKQCFIATAVYGSPFSPEVETLRQWRDRSLSATVIGRSFISTYYKYSPRTADYIKERTLLKKLIKKALDGVVWIVRR